MVRHEILSFNGGAFPLFTFAGDFKVVRYNPNGSLDTSFGSSGIVTTTFFSGGSYAFAVALQADALTSNCVNVHD